MYGIHPKNSMCRCPFHGPDRHPSMKVYEDSCHCFTCSKTWDVFAFVMEYEGVDFKTAFQKLGGEYKHSRSSPTDDYFNEAKRGTQKKPQKAKPMDHKEEMQQMVREEHENANKLLKALTICYKADVLTEWGSPEWHRLKSLTGYLEQLYDEMEYDWRTVEALIALYVKAEPIAELTQMIDEYRMEVNISSIREVRKDGYSS